MLPVQRLVSLFASYNSRKQDWPEGIYGPPCTRHCDRETGNGDFRLSLDANFIVSSMQEKHYCAAGICNNFVFGAERLYTVLSQKSVRLHRTGHGLRKSHTFQLNATLSK
jgi:hypothetical protein